VLVHSSHHSFVVGVAVHLAASSEASSSRREHQSASSHDDLALLLQVSTKSPGTLLGLRTYQCSECGARHIYNQMNKKSKCAGLAQEIGFCSCVRALFAEAVKRHSK
jgi:predicted Zn-ribbon and HTH transcriptional regulator